MSTSWQPVKENNATLLNRSNEKENEPNGPNKPKDDKNIWGRTKDGNRFIVPETSNMVQTLLDPRLSKTPIDFMTIFICLQWVLIYFWLPKYLLVPCFCVIFAFWRITYNAGIGYLLARQSSHEFLVEFAKKNKLFDSQNKKFLPQFVQKDLMLRLMSTQDQVDKLPIEFKTWVIFRHFVDLVLMNDFVTYCLLACACFHKTQHSWLIFIGRWLAGLVLLVFNAWVKLDAHRVVKTFAWYWGDFFFLQDVNLTFDGVFELAPHPMYSIGYAAYYGVSLITSSYTLFFVSALAHASQFAFLILVENPHIDKTYNTPEPPKPKHITTEFDAPRPQAMLGFLNFSFTRSSDIILVFTTVTMAMGFFIPASRTMTVLCTVGAIAWRIVHSLGLGVLLSRQSKTKRWARLHLRYGGSSLGAYLQFQAIYNFTLVMAYVSLYVLALREMSSPFKVKFWPFKFIIGVLLMALQAWTSYSVYDELGEYGWFYGDFFYRKESHKLTYSGIYRYLNHPERVIGVAGVFGLSLICSSPIVTFVAFFWLTSNILFIQFVEKPHMYTIYGKDTQRLSGVSKNIRWQGKYLPEFCNPDNIERTLQKAWDSFVLSYFDRIESLRPRMLGIVDDSKTLLQQYPAQATTITSGSIEGLDLAKYSITTNKRVYSYGESITVDWTSCPQRSKSDWIGLYRSGENTSQTITTVSSCGRWSGVDKSGFWHHTKHIQTSKATSGSIDFSSEILFWQPGKYEFRYHHNGKHNVIATSQPLEIVVEQKNVHAPTLESDLLLMYHRCGGQGDVLNLDDNQVLARFTYFIYQVYDIDLAPFVVHNDATTDRIAARLVATHEALSAN